MTTEQRDRVSKLAEQLFSLTAEVESIARSPEATNDEKEELTGVVDELHSAVHSLENL